jgi:ABC-type cobalt transport system substrate-binding protein
MITEKDAVNEYSGDCDTVCEAISHMKELVERIENVMYDSTSGEIRFVFSIKEKFNNGDERASS